jgi:hypothetical protein
MEFINHFTRLPARENFCRCESLKTYTCIGIEILLLFSQWAAEIPIAWGGIRFSLDAGEDGNMYYASLYLYMHEFLQLY